MGNSKLIKEVKSSAPGKIILSGEHSVVYGYPALISAINRRLVVILKKIDQKKDVIFTPESDDLARYGLKKLKFLLKEQEKGLRVQIKSEIPVSRGMGSSAALAVALTSAVFKITKNVFTLEEINQCAYEIEKKQHGNPSGADNSTSLYGGFLRFQRQKKGQDIFHQLKPKNKPKILLIDSGRKAESTGQMVSSVKDYLTKYPRKVKRILKEMGEITFLFSEFLIEGKNHSFRELLKENQRLLEEIRVVSPRAKRIINKIEKIGGAAKISGSGGIKDGSGILIAYHDDLALLNSFVKKEGLLTYEVKLGGRGMLVK